jgi:uncharacterized membrane protein/mono/diheme cytochrome c family protein
MNMPRTRISIFVCVVVAVGIAAPRVFAQGPTSSSAANSEARANLAPTVLSLFQVKCVQCHGPQVATPPKGFGYVTDLPKLLQSGKVVPGKPEDSLLFKMISSGMMPPATAKNGGLSPEQVETVRAWIAAGAAVAGAPTQPATEGAASQGVPDAGSAVVPRALPSAVPRAATQPAAPSSFQRLAAWAGPFHLQLIHFPIALILAGALAEFLNLMRPTPQRRWCARFCLWLGAIGAAASACTGYLLAYSKTWTPPQAEVLEDHEWLGISTAILAAVMLVLGFLLLRRGGKAATWAYFVGIVCLAVVVSLAGHFGGLLAWGGDSLGW